MTDQPPRSTAPWKTFVSYEDLRSPPLSERARRRVGYLLRRLQQGHQLGEPVSKRLKATESLFELRIPDDSRSWRIIYYTGPDEVVVLRLFAKTTRKTPHQEIRVSLTRLARYLDAKGT